MSRVTIRQESGITSVSRLGVVIPEDVGFCFMCELVSDGLELFSRNGEDTAYDLQVCIAVYSRFYVDRLIKIAVPELSQSGLLMSRASILTYERDQEVALAQGLSTMHIERIGIKREEVRFELNSVTETVHARPISLWELRGFVIPEELAPQYRNL